MYHHAVTRNRMSPLQDGTKPSFQFKCSRGPIRVVKLESRSGSGWDMTTARALGHQNSRWRFYYYKGITWSEFQMTFLSFRSVRIACKNQCAEGFAVCPKVIGVCPGFAQGFARRVYVACHDDHQSLHRENLQFSVVENCELACIGEPRKRYNDHRFVHRETLQFLIVGD